jgi:hypothetical protein
VVSAIAQHALENGLILQFRTLEANTSSVAIALTLGFELYARTIAVRLSAEQL